nr:uncharacterized protein LOC117985736 [Maniola hyperantus]
MTLRNGRRLIMYQKHTFSFQGNQGSKSYLYCSKKHTTRCEARLQMNKAEEIVYAHTEHNHKPPVFQKCSDDKRYFKIVLEQGSFAFKSRREKRMCTFRNSWVAEMPWIEPLNERHKAYCKYCEKAISIAHGGINDIYRHRQSMKHIRKERKINSV